MAWGIVEPKGLGEYFPDGDYIGFTQQLDYYYQTEMPLEEKVAMGMEAGVLYSAFTAKFTRDRGKLRPQEQPKAFRTAKTYKTLGSLIKLNERLLAVDENLMTAIERLEPDRHQFWPIRIEMPAGEYPGQYYGLVIRTFIDSFIPDQCKDGTWRKRGSGIYQPNLPSAQCYRQLVLSEATIGEAHLWREVKLGSPESFVSDTLKAEIERRNLRIPAHYQMQVAKDETTSAY